MTEPPTSSVDCVRSSGDLDQRVQQTIIRERNSGLQMSYCIDNEKKQVY